MLAFIIKNDQRQNNNNFFPTTKDLLGFFEHWVIQGGKKKSVLFVYTPDDPVKHNRLQV